MWFFLCVRVISVLIAMAKLWELEELKQKKNLQISFPHTRLKVAQTSMNLRTFYCKNAKIFWRGTCSLFRPYTRRGLAVGCPDFSFLKSGNPNFTCVLNKSQQT
jgi:hypothetical protein